MSRYLSSDDVISNKERTRLPETIDPNEYMEKALLGDIDLVGIPTARPLNYLYNQQWDSFEYKVLKSHDRRDITPNHHWRGPTLGVISYVLIVSREGSFIYIYDSMSVHRRDRQRDSYSNHEVYEYTFNKEDISEALMDIIEKCPTDTATLIFPSYEKLLKEKVMSSLNTKWTHGTLSEYPIGYYQALKLYSGEALACLYEGYKNI